MPTKKSTKKEISAGGVVFQEKDDQVLWLLIRPKNNSLHWRFPKGVIEKNESAEEAAIREVEEETGIKAGIIGKIGRTTYFYTFKKKRIFKIIAFYLMKFLSVTGAPDGLEVEKIGWFPHEEAYERLTFKPEKAILEKAKKALEEKGNQPSLF